MATVTPIQSRNLAEDNRRVHNPLDRLRGYIRSYVGLEGLARALIFMTLWFWVGFALDYGLFKLVGLDLVQVLPLWVRAGILGLLTTVIVLVVSVQMLTRLLREFSDPALALVLEKRFPKLLGDRLITAVELSDPDKAAQYGYSRAMVRETIGEAADRVDQLPLGQVFDWQRLVRRGIFIAVMTVAGYLLAVTVFGTLAFAREGRSMLLGFNRFNDVATIWFERNILLQNTIWPRESHMIVIQPADDPLRIGRDAAAPGVIVRTIRYVIADRTAPEGWRALTCQDLRDRPELLKGEDVPLPPEDWRARDKDLGLTVDEIDLKLGRIGIRMHSDNGKPLPAKWSIVDAKAEGGYRPLLWSDLSRLPLGELSVPPLSSSWDLRAWPVAGSIGLISSLPGQGSLLASTSMGTGPMGLTVDEVEEHLKKAGDKPIAEAQPGVGLEGGLAGDARAGVQVVLDRLERIHLFQVMLDRLNERVAEPSLSRTMRKLKIPSTATLVYGTWATSIRKTLQKSIEDERTGNEFTGVFSDLKPGTYRYRVYGEDYSTPSRTLVVLPPPALESLSAEESRPAYLYYHPAPGSSGKELRGLKQHFAPIDVANFGSDVSRVEVPSGTDVKLLAEVNDELREDGVEIKPAKEGDKVPYKDLNQDGKRFEASFVNVRQEINFVFVFYNKDGVMGSRAVLIKPKDDQAPELNEVLPDVVRKTKEGYIVSVRARVPFVGRVRDDNGLSGVRYAYTLSKVDSGPRINVQALLMVASVPALAAGGPSNAYLGAASYATAQLEGFRPADTESGGEVVERLGNLAAFEQALKDHSPKKGELEILPMQRVKEMLAEKQKLPFRTLLTDLELKPDTWESAATDPLVCDFPLWKEMEKKKLIAPTSRDIQIRFKMQLWLEARDTDLDSEVEKDGTPRPHVSPSKEKFSFLVVSENELLAEIAKEEEELRIKLEETFNLLLEAEAKLIRETIDLTSLGIKPENMGAMAGRVDTVDQVLDKQQQKTKEVSNDYKRILQELRTNQVQPKMINDVNKDIVSPLADIAGDEFVRTHVTLDDFKKALEAGRGNAANFPDNLAAARTAGTKARDQVRVLKDALAKVLESMQKVTDVNKLILILRKIEEAQQAQYDVAKRIKDELEDRIFKGAIKDSDPKKP